jgi:hypothetical protein
MGWKRVLGSAVFAGALVAGAALGTAIGTAGGPYDDWGCPSEQITREVYTPAEAGGYKTRDEALTAMVDFLATDGDQARSEYADAIASRTGPTRYDPELGRVYIADKVEVELHFEQLPDGTWTPSEVTLCGRPVPPEIASPYPTPVDEVAG